MKNKTFKRFFALTVCIITAIMLSVTASADMIGTKPSVNVYIENLGNRECYVNLLTPESYKPFWDYNLGNISSPENWNYNDPDGFTNEEGWRVSENKMFTFELCKPDEFKIVLYFPDLNTYAVSGICETYARDTYYSVNLLGVDLPDNSNGESAYVKINAYKAYNSFTEIASLILRIILTILIEIAVALLFRYREKKQILLLIIVNTITQIGLNILLSIVDNLGGKAVFVISYMFLEPIVFFIEAIVYCNLMNKFSEKKRSEWIAFLYAMAANFCSLIGGIVIEYFVPGII